MCRGAHINGTDKWTVAPKPNTCWFLDTPVSWASQRVREARPTLPQGTARHSPPPMPTVASRLDKSGTLSPSVDPVVPGANLIARAEIHADRLSAAMGVGNEGGVAWSEHAAKAKRDEK